MKSRMVKLQANGLFVMSALMVHFGCFDEGSENESVEFNLADLSNPFLGEWESDIPSAGTTITFDYHEDGTFDYVMDGVSEEQGGVGSGGYAVYEDKMITWLDFEGASAYSFEVVDNDTISVTELSVDADGTIAEGNTTPFTRVEGSDVYQTDITLQLENVFLGKWESEIPSAGTTIAFDYHEDATFDYEREGVSADEGGVGVGFYLVYENHMVTWLDFEGAASYEFEVQDDTTIHVTELEYDADGNLTAGNTTDFIKIEE